MATRAGNVTYRRVRTGPGGTSFLGRRQSLWLAEDHLLVVESTYFVQTAARVDLKDIEAIALYPTAEYAWVNALAAVPCLIGGGMVSTGSTPWLVFGALLLGPCLFILLLNLLRGRTCACRLQTRVASRTLYAPGRYGSARRLLALLSPLILAAQADLPPVAGSLAARLAPAAGPAVGPTPGGR
jgi:hypothetical protein